MKDGIRNAIIKNAAISIADHGQLCTWLELDYGGTGQSFGGYSLCNVDATPGEIANTPNYAGIHLIKIMVVAGVESWSLLKGKPIRVDLINGRIVAIGHIIEDEWFYPDLLAKKVNASEAA